MTRSAYVQSTFDFAIREINALETRIVTAEDDADAMLWEQARQVVAQLNTPGMTQRKLAAGWINVRNDNKPYSQAHVSYTRQVFDNYGYQTSRPRFREAYYEVKTAADRQDRVDKIVEISRGNEALGTAQRYPVIYADPPWRYEHVKTESRAIENQYPTLTLEEICALPVSELATDDAVLLLWATSPKLDEAMSVIEAWGFTYRTNAAWTKDKIGMGYYFRQQHELLLVAARGDLPVPAAADRLPSVFMFPRGEHSAKPREFYDVIERMYPAYAKIELFARAPRDGWSVWGNQAVAP